MLEHSNQMHFLPQITAAVSIWILGRVPLILVAQLNWFSFWISIHTNTKDITGQYVTLIWAYLHICIFSNVLAVVRIWILGRAALIWACQIIESHLFSEFQVHLSQTSSAHILAASCQHWGRSSAPHLGLSNDCVIVHQIAPAVNIWILWGVFQIWARQMIESQSFLEFQIKLSRSPLDSTYNLISHSVSEEELQSIALTVALESRVVCVTVAWMKSQENSAAVAASPVLIVQLEMLALLHCPTLVWIWIFKFQWNTLVTPGSKSHKSQRSLRGGGTFAFASLDLDLQMAVTHF